MFRFPRVLWLVGILAVLLSLPSVFADLYTDDQGMVLSIEGVAPPPIPGPFHLYTFMTGAPGERDKMVELGEIPWWSVNGIRISFFRPLSSALLTLDHAIAGRRPLFYHLHSVAWYVAAALSAAALFRRLLPEHEAAIAALLFVVAPAHWMLGAWPSARHVAISGTFTIWALILHLEARHRTSARGLTLGALACAVLALAGGETALGVFGFVASYELLGRREPLAGRLRALLPWGALFLTYAALYRALHYGVRNCGAYVDPIAQPLTYLSLLPTRLAVYLDSALLCVPSEISMLSARATPILAAMGVAAGLLFMALFRRALRELGSEQSRTHAWLFLGALLAVLPGIASIPGDRVLFLPDLALAPGLAVVLLYAGVKTEAAPLVLLSRIGLGFFALVHVVLAPLLFLFGAENLASTSHAAITAASHAEIPVRANLSVVGIGLSDPMVGMYLASALYVAPRPEPRPRAVQLLSMAAHDHSVTRTDDRTLEVTIRDGTMLEGALDYLFRPPSNPLHIGDTLPIGAWSIRILDETAGRPSRFSITFDRSVDDPSLAFLIWKDKALRALVPPKVGEQVLIKHEDGPMGM
ncbi:MAG TPA: hypothetical protein VHW01_13965 [Polyangiaceae bacterium]|nr:hypothetical protein [Polyangiaceae bacterium]